jgi:2-polyprenyl-6-methoxyphenol hydroxylase-like FAD-dependent oxidoreductase
MRIAVVGAGLAGLSSAAAFSRSGHEVAVFEQADELRADGLAINLWSNATSLLPTFGIPAARLPGEPFSRMVFRASGRDVAVTELPARGLPHVNVERAELLSALAAVLPANAIRYGARCADVQALAADHDLVVAADGTNSVLRSAVAGPVGKRWSWTVWQASVTAEVPQLLSDSCANVVRSGFFSGIFRLRNGRVTWFAEQSGLGLGRGAGEQLLHELTGDEDELLRTVAQATAADQWTEWHAEDMWPPRTLHRGNIVLIGDAGHAMLPTIGQGACQALEDAAVLAAAVAAEPSLDQALRRYTAIRVPRLRKVVALARVSALSRRPSMASRLMPATTSARLMARSGGRVLRWVTRPVIAAP